MWYTAPVSSGGIWYPSTKFWWGVGGRSSGGASSGGRMSFGGSTHGGRRRQHADGKLARGAPVRCTGCLGNFGEKGEGERELGGFLTDKWATADTQPDARMGGAVREDPNSPQILSRNRSPRADSLCRNRSRARGCLQASEPGMRTAFCLTYRGRWPALLRGRHGRCRGGSVQSRTTT
jgi:hypothetical protein